MTAPSLPERRVSAVVAVTNVLGSILLVAIAIVVWVAVHTEHLNAAEFFERHREDFDRVAQLVDGQPGAPTGEEYYNLPKDLRYLSATDRVSIFDDGSFFIPRWTGIPDDAGGLWYSTTSPKGRDMYGLWCADPTDLGDGWWACAA